MSKKHIITLAGDPASGKGTVSKLLEKELNYTIYRNGEYFRKLAKEHNMSVTEFNIYVKDHPEIDIEIEKSAEKYAEEHDNLIIDARLGFFVVPDSFKVYLTIELMEAARRAFNDQSRKDTESFESVEEHAADMKKRYELENERYYNVYTVRKDDMSHYDLVLDTTSLSPEEVKEKILTEYFKWLKNH